MDLVKVKSLGSNALYVDKESLKYFVMREYDKEASEVLKILKNLSGYIRIPKIVYMKKEYKKITTIEEYIQGESLAELIGKGKHITQDQFVTYGLEICETLKVLHEKGIIHKDIKPANLILADKGVYIIDFDISRTYKENQTRDTKLYATEGYASPEQFGFSQTTVKSDVFSLGITLKELLMITIVDPTSYKMYDNLIDQMTKLDPNKRISLYEVVSQLEDREESQEQVKEERYNKLPPYLQTVKSFLNGGEEKGLNFKFAGLIINNQSIVISILQSLFYFAFVYSLIKDEYASSNPSTIGIVASYYIATIITNYFIQYATRKMLLATENDNVGAKVLVGFGKVMFDFIFFAIIIQWPYI